MLSLFHIAVDMMISIVAMFKTTFMQPKKKKKKNLQLLSQDCFEHDLHGNVMIKHAYFVLVKICHKKDQLKHFSQ